MFPHLLVQKRSARFERFWAIVENPWDGSQGVVAEKPVQRSPTSQDVTAVCLGVQIRQLLAVQKLLKGEWYFLPRPGAATIVGGAWPGVEESEKSKGCWAVA